MSLTPRALPASLMSGPGSPIPAGRRIGAYEVQAALGAGGMGVVYRALDTKLNRPVAIKFLSDDLADAAARRRFQREAQTASSLNHPHIVTVYDVGEFDGRQYLVTEFVDGGTLKDWAQPRSARGGRSSSCWSASPMAWPPPTRPASSIATSSPRTSWWRRTATPSWPISAWPNSGKPPTA